MTDQTDLNFTKLKDLNPPKDNPRKVFDESYIESLALSIKADGVLQSLVVKPLKGKKSGFEIISGECRYRALNILLDRGDIEKDYLVPTLIKKGVSASEASRIAVVENLQRQDMHPMDEAHAVVSLIHDGESLEDVAQKTGFSLSLIKQRIALTALCEEAQEALRAGDITLSVASALTLGTQDRQKKLLEDGISHCSAQDIKDELTDEKIPLSSAIFPIDQYQGSITRDLFFNEDESYFDNREEFFDLQDDAVQALKQKKEDEGYSPVEICEDRWFSRCEYRQALEGEQGGCVIHFSPNGDVSVHEGLVSRALDKKVVEEIKESTLKKTYSSSLCEYIAMQKSLAVQNALLTNPRKAKEVAVVLLICNPLSLSDVKLGLHKCHAYFEKLDMRPRAFKSVNEHIYSLLGEIGIDANIEDAVYGKLLSGWRDPSKMYEAVKALSDDDLDKLHLLLTTLCFGQGGINLDCSEDSFFNHVAKDLDVDMRDYWTPDEYFLARLKAENIAKIIAKTNTNHLFGSLIGFKKKDMVSILVKHFKKLAGQDICEGKDIDAKNWLPEGMHFPAIDPDEVPLDDAELDKVA